MRARPARPATLVAQGSATIFALSFCRADSQCGHTKNSNPQPYFSINVHSSTTPSSSVIGASRTAWYPHDSYNVPALRMATS